MHPPSAGIKDLPHRFPSLCPCFSLICHFPFCWVGIKISVLCLQLAYLLSLPLWFGGLFSSTLTSQKELSSWDFAKASFSPSCPWISPHQQKLQHQAMTSEVQHFLCHCCLTNFCLGFCSDCLHNLSAPKGFLMPSEVTEIPQNPLNVLGVSH